MAAQLARYPQLADLLGERHRIISNDRRSAELQRLVGRILARAAELLDAIDFTPAALREDLRTPARYLFSIAELIDHAVDLTAQSAALVHENERRWRVFRERAETFRGHATGAVTSSRCRVPAPRIGIGVGLPRVDRLSDELAGWFVPGPGGPAFLPAG